MKLIIGLGNPGKKYEKTRHNAGFLTIDNLQLITSNFTDWKFEKKFNAEISRGEINGEKVILVKPQTFMNESGKSVKKIIENRKLKIENLFVIHDDIDLPLGKIRIKKNGSSGGHQGVQSIINALGTPNFIRFKIGVGLQTRPKTFDAAKFVLQKFAKEEEKKIAQITKKTAEAILTVLSDGVEAAMNKFN